MDWFRTKSQPQAAESQAKEVVGRIVSPGGVHVEVKGTRIAAGSDLLGSVAAQGTEHAVRKTMLRRDDSARRFEL